MGITQLESQIRYVKNAAGITTDVLVPLEVWQQLLHVIAHESGLAYVDEQESNPDILADLQESVRLGAKGQTFPIAELWNDLTT